MNKTELEQNYLETTYSVFIGKYKYDIKVGDIIPADVNKLILNCDVKSAVIFTAWNPRSQSFSLEENKSRNTALMNNLDNYTVLQALGQGTDVNWPAEESFFIIGIREEELKQLAIKYEQYAYVWFEVEKPVSLRFSPVWTG